MEDLEFLLEDEADVQLTGVMFRKLGEHVDEEVFGELPKRFKVPTGARAWHGGNEGVEYK